MLLDEVVNTNQQRRIHHEQGYDERVSESRGSNASIDLTDLLREGAKRLIAEAVDAEPSAILTQFEDYKDQSGRRHVVRNGYLPEREILTVIGPVSVRVPKVRDRGGTQIKFNSALVPPYLRRVRSVEEVLP